MIYESSLLPWLIILLHVKTCVFRQFFSVTDYVLVLTATCTSDSDRDMADTVLRKLSLTWCTSSCSLLFHQLLLGVATIGPWAVMIVYDLLLYIVRSITYEIPHFGGRARGRRRPRAPSLAERPNGRPRSFSISVQSPTSGSENEQKNVLRERLRDSPARDED